MIEQTTPSKNILIVSNLAWLGTQKMWGRHTDVIDAKSGKEALQKLESRSLMTLDLVVVQLSVFRPWFANIRKHSDFQFLRSFLIQLTERIHPDGVLLIEDDIGKPIDYEYLSREFDIRIRPWRAALETATRTLGPSRSITNLFLDCRERQGVNDDHQVTAVVSDHAESGWHQWDVTSTYMDAIVNVTEKTNQLPENLKRMWQGFASERGYDLQNALLSRSRPACVDCVKPTEASCVLEEVIRGNFEPNPYPEVVASGGSSLVAVARESMGPLAPVEFLPWPDGNGSEQCLYEAKPVMHQLLLHGPPNAHHPRPPFRDTNFLLICTDSGRDSLDGLQYAVKEINSLHDLLQAQIEREEGKGSVEKFFARDYANFDAFQDELRKKHEKTEWHVVHWAGHANIKKNNQQASFPWPTSPVPKFRKPSSGSLSNNDVAKFIGELKPSPLLVHFSCCSVAATRFPPEILRVGVPYVMAHRWKVLDKQGPEFANFFYRNWLLYGTHPAVALWKTRRQMPYKRIAASSVLIGGTHWDSWES